MREHRIFVVASCGTISVAVLRVVEWFEFEEEVEYAQA